MALTPRNYYSGFGGGSANAPDWSRWWNQVREMDGVQDLMDDIIKEGTGLDPENVNSMTHQGAIITLFMKVSESGLPPERYSELKPKMVSWARKETAEGKEFMTAYKAFQNSLESANVTYDKNDWSSDKLFETFKKNYAAQGGVAEAAANNTISQIQKSAPSETTADSSGSPEMKLAAQQEAARQEFAKQLNQSTAQYEQKIPELAGRFKETAMQTVTEQEPELLRVLKEAGVGGPGLRSGGVQAGIASELASARNQASLSAADYERGLLEQLYNQQMTNQQAVAQVGLTQAGSMQEFLIQDYLTKFGYDAQLKAQMQAQNSQLQAQLQSQNFSARENAKNRALQWDIANLRGGSKTSKTSSTVQGAVSGAMAGGSVGGPWGALAGGILGGVGGYNQAVQSNSGYSQPSANYSQLGALLGQGVNYWNNRNQTYPTGYRTY